MVEQNCEGSDIPDNFEVQMESVGSLEVSLQPNCPAKSKPKKIETPIPIRKVKSSLEL